MKNRIPSVIGLAQIMREAFAGSDLSQLTQRLVQRISQDSRDSAALLDLCVVKQLQGQPAAALQLQWEALQQHQHYRLSTNVARPALRVLAVMGPGEVMANTPIEFLLEKSDIALELLYVGAGLPPVHDIPPHDVAFVAVCESDANQVLLQQLHSVMTYWPHPHLNAPLQIAQVARDGLSGLLADIPGTHIVCSQRVSRAELEEPDAAALSYPSIIRPANSHAGHGLSRIEHASDLHSYLQAQPEAEFSVAPFVEYRTAEDGLYRKYRVAQIAGQAYPAHMAISPRWMVHYLNADMLDNAAHRAAEQRFMDRFDWEFGQRHASALAAIDRRLGLDYYSIDCGETPDGQLLVFEVDSGAVVHSMDPVDRFPYKPPHMQRLFSAFQALLKRTAGVARMPLSQPQPTRRRAA